MSAFNNSETVQKFEELLRRKVTEQFPKIYSNTKNQGPAYSDAKHCYNQKDVITNIAAQIKAIQSADCVNKSNNTNKLVTHHKKSHFIPVDKLEMHYEATQKNKNLGHKETQFELDTQVMNIIDNVETVNTCKGITQEFNMSFEDSSNILNASNVKVQNELVHVIYPKKIDDTNRFNPYKSEVQSVIKEDHSNKSMELNDFREENETRYNGKKSLYDIEVIVANIESKTGENRNEEIKSHNIELNTNCSEILHKCMEVEENLNLQDIDVNKMDITPSPIIGINKLATKSVNHSPLLVYNLDSFEKFEEIAIPIIEETGDLNKAKHLIHSQIIGKELSIQTHLQSRISAVQDQLSPVLSISKDKLEESAIFNSSFNTDENVSNELLDFEIGLNKSQVVGLRKCLLGNATNSKENCDISKNFVDDILFSSDEETDKNKDLQDLPFTCALETSFYDQPDVLDKTMYVGFQTASNRSIQISTVSFTKAKNLLDQLENKLNTDVHTLKDLVEKCDNSLTINKTFDKICDKMNNDTINEEKNPYLTEIVTDETNGKVTTEFFEVKSVDENTHEICNSNLNKLKAQFQGIESRTENNCKSQKPLVDKRKFGGFKTANNKRIKLSDQALARCKRVFHDIDLDDTFSDSNDVQNCSNINISSKKKLQNENSIEKEKNLLDYLNLTKMDDDILMEFKGEMEFTDNNDRKKDNTSSSFVGFKTASDKDIKISNEALAKSNQVFDNVVFSEIINNENYIADAKMISNKHIDEIHCKAEREIPSSFMGFKTASNKHIEVSEKALAKIDTVFHDIDLELVAPKPNESIGLELSRSRSKDKTRQDSDFNTNVKKINKVPEVTETFQVPNLRGTNSTWNHTETSILPKHFGDSSLPNKIQFMGFRTGNNNKIIISKAALAKTKNIFRDIDMDNAETSSGIESVQFDFIDNENSNFRKESVNMIINNSNRKANEELIHDFISHPNVKELSFKGFETSNNKSVNVSEESSKINNMTTNLEIDESNNDVIETDCTNNKKEDMTRETLAINNKIFDHSDLYNFCQSTETAFKGFQTANNKPVKISAEALAKTKSIFQGIDTNENNKENNNLQFKGFHTANNKAVKVSTAALAESKKILKGDMTIHSINKNILSVTGFQQETTTTSNKNVIVSDDELQRSKKILCDINLIEENENSESKLSQVFGVKTLNNNNYKISDMNANILKKSTKLYADIKNNFNVVIDSKRYQIEYDKKEKYRITDGNTFANGDNLENLINTQVVNNFEEALNTEDFLPTPEQPKRSASPILSCPKAKKRKKFETPYANCKVNIEIDIKHNYTEYTEIFNTDYKKNKRYTLKDLQLLNNIEKHKYIDAYLLNFNYNNLLQFEFSSERNDLIESKLTIQLLKDYFRKLVNKKLIPDNWLDIQFKLILWKLLSYELKFPNIMSGICTVKNVLKQLKYRYTRELYNAERPAIRKILERDEVASKLLVLCVVEIGPDTEENGAANTTELLLTDGWYCIKGCIDKTLAKYVKEGKIVVGSKIVTHGAELLNCDQGIAPWEDTSSVRLKLFGNSTRRARWDARLGFHGNVAMLSHLSAVKPDGGKVSKLRVLVTRVYPPLYVEKFEDGSTVTRSERLEHIHQTKYEADREALMEKLYEEAEKELDDEESPDSDTDTYRTLDGGSQIARMMKRSKQPTQFRESLTDSQKRLLYDHSIRKRDRLLQNVQTKVLSKMDKCGLQQRNVIPLMKVRIAEVEDKNGQVDVVKAQLSIWKPNDALTELITEGACVEILNVVPTAVRYSELQLSAGRQTTFKQCNFKENEKLKPYITSLHRVCYPIKDLSVHTMMDYNEIDTVGIVFQIDPSKREFNSNNQFQNVYITDDNKNVICVNFWGGIRKFGFENILDTGQIVACVNLQKRAGNTRRNIQHYRATEFTYFTKTPKSVAARENIDELSKKFSTVNINKFIDDCVIYKNNLLKCNSENFSPYRFNNYDLSKTKLVIDSHKTNKLQEDFNLSGLDFESTFKQTDTQELSPNSLSRRKIVNSKIAKLKMYGEPPPLSPLNIINKSKNAAMSYKSPLIKANGVTSTTNDSPKVAGINNTPNKNRANLEINRSPVLSVNRTYVKSVKPVKLNFNSVAVEENEEIDHFAGEFDASPPLSLE